MGILVFFSGFIFLVIVQFFGINTRKESLGPG